MMRGRKLLFVILFIILLPALLSADTAAIRRLLSDINVAYVYEKESSLDWPFLFYLENELGAKISLITLESGLSFSGDSVKSVDNALIYYNFLVTDTSAAGFGYVISAVYGEVVPDIIIFSGKFKRGILNRFESYLLALPFDSSSVYNPVKFYNRTESPDSGTVNLNRQLYLHGYYEAIGKFAGSVMNHPDIVGDDATYSTYRLIKSNLPPAETASLLEGIISPKLRPLSRKFVTNLYDYSTIETNIESYLTYLKQALAENERHRTDNLLTALGLLKKIERTYLSEKGASSGTIFGRYLGTAVSELTAAAFDDAGISCEGETSIFESSEGVKVKFLSRVYNDGPFAISFGPLKFKPYWADTATTLDTAVSEIPPYNIFAREYLVPVEKFQLESLRPESLLFMGQVQLKNNPIEFKYGLKTLVKLPLKIMFAPRFYVMKPFPKLQVDKLVQPFQLGLLLQKPASYTGELALKIEASPGMTVGAYAKKLTLTDGEDMLYFDIPMAVGGSLGPAKKQIAASIWRGDKFLTSDTAHFRLADYSIKENLKVALLPDDSGVLEDIFRMTSVNYRTISDHFLLNGDLDFFDVMVLGAGCIKNFPSLSKANEQLKKFVEYGGTILVFCQPSGNFDEILPVTISSGRAFLDGGDIETVKMKHPILNRPYEISIQNFLKGIKAAYPSYPAEFPGSDKIMAAKEKGAVLAEKKSGHGKIIYCGLPIVEMFSDLDIEAIKFFSNLLNYCAR